MLSGRLYIHYALIWRYEFFLQYDFCIIKTATFPFAFAHNDSNAKERKSSFCQQGLSFSLAHFVVSVGNRETANELTERLRADGYTILSKPRTTGDGYYESAIADWNPRYFYRVYFKL